MIKSTHMMEKLDQVYFHLLTEAPRYTFERMIQQTASRIGTVANMIYVAFLIQKNWSGGFELVAESFRESEANLSHEQCTYHIHTCLYHLNSAMDQTAVTEDQLFTWGRTVSESIIIQALPLSLSEHAKGYLVCIYPKDQDEQVPISSLQTKTEQLLTTVQWIDHQRQTNAKKDFLFDITSEFYTSTDHVFILEETILALEFLYPSYTYQLLLSQDHNADSSLPIQMIEYSGKSTKRVAYDVFISGDWQIEYRKDLGKSCLYAPLTGKQGIYGVLQMIVDEKVHFPETEIKFITLFSKIIGEALENTMLYQHSKHQVSDLQLINEVTHKLNSNLTLTDIISVMKTQITNTCSPTHIGFIYFDHEVLGHRDGIDILQGSSPFFRTKDGFACIKELIKETVEHKEMLFNGDYVSETIELPFRSIIVLPMIHANDVHGIFIITHAHSSAFSFQSFKFMQSLIQHTTLALTNAILKNKLERAVITDYLTGLYSRGYLDEKITLHMQKAIKGTLVLFDIDDFKDVNDQYGHQKGDEIIIQVAKILLANTRQDDIASRWGGEEFALYLPGASLEEGVRIANRICEKIAKKTMPQVTFSSGVSSWDGTKKHSVYTLFAEADQFLYSAKDQGKNRVVYESENNV